MQRLLNKIITNFKILFFRDEINIDDLYKYEIMIEEIISSN